MRKSQKSFGQKNALIEAATWSGFAVVSTLAVRVGIGGMRGNGGLTGCGGEDDEAGPMVLYQLAHREEERQWWDHCY